MEYKNIINIKIKDFQLVEDNNYKALNKQFVDTEHLYVFDYNRSKIFHINIPINTLDEDIPFNTIKLKGTKVEIKEFIAIMTIDCENSDLIRLSNLYDIDWKTNNTFKDKNIKDITVKDYNNYIKSISIVSNL